MLTRKPVRKVHVELMGVRFALDLHAPRDLARSLFGNIWIDHFLTNEQVLFDPDTHVVHESVSDVPRFALAPRFLLAGPR
jgi:hypothetical protein